MTSAIFTTRPARALVTLALAATLAPGLAAARTPIDETRPLDDGAAVWIENVKGRIQVDTWDRPEIHIGGELGDGVEKLAVEGSGSTVRVKVIYPKDGWFGGSNGGEPSELVVRVPANVELTVDAVSADVTVRGVAGKRLDIDAVSGDVEVESSAGRIEIDSVSGDVSARVVSDEVDIESVSGDIELVGTVRRSVALESVSGDVGLDTGERLSQLKAGVVSGDISLRAGMAADARINAESLSGDLELVLPANTSARLKASSFTGTLSSDAGRVIKPEHGPGSNLDAVLGDGSGDIVLETFSGDLSIRLR